MTADWAIASTKARLQKTPHTRLTSFAVAPRQFGAPLAERAAASRAESIVARQARRTEKLLVNDPVFLVSCSVGARFANDLSMDRVTAAQLLLSP